MANISRRRKLFQLPRINVMKIAHDRLKCPFNLAIKCQLIHEKLSRKFSPEWLDILLQRQQERSACLPLLHCSGASTERIHWHITCHDMEISFLDRHKSQLSHITLRLFQRNSPEPMAQHALGGGGVNISGNYYNVCCKCA